MKFLKFMTMAFLLAATANHAVAQDNAEDYSWTSLGNGDFTDAFMFNDTYSVEIQQCDQDEHMFRLVNPYTQGLKNEGYLPDYYKEGPSEYVVFKVLQPGDKLSETTITLNDLVYYEDYRTGYYQRDYDAEVWACHPSGNFNATPTEDTWAYNKVLSYQENGLPAIVQFAPFYYMFRVGGWNYSQQDGVITIVFPGVYIPDYSCDIKIADIYTSPEDEQFLMAEVKLGPDVDHAWCLVVKGRYKAQDVYSKLLEGSLEYVAVTESGSILIPMSENAPIGKYTVVIFSFDDQGQTIEDYKEEAHYSFNYVYGIDSETWTPVYQGTYTYTQFFGSEQEPADDEGLMLYESDQAEGRYRIADWGYGVDFIFQMNEDGSCMVEDQFTGYTHSSYGDAYVDDLVDYTGETDRGYSYYADGVFHFAVIYYVDAGYFGFGEETFRITEKYVPEAIDDIDADANVIATDYFNTAGMKLNDWANYHGTLIKRQTLSNGKTKTTKIMK